MEYRERNFTHLIHNEKNREINWQLQLLESHNLLTKAEKQYAFIKYLRQLLPDEKDEKIVFEIYTNAAASFQ